MHEPIDKPYPEARQLIRDADMLLFRPTTLPGAVIASGTDSNLSHAAMAIWWHGRLMCVGTQQWRGNQPDHLSRLVSRYPGVIEVHRLYLPTATWRQRSLADEERTAVAGQMIDMVSQRYGWLSLAKAALINARLSRWFWREMLDATNDNANGSRPHCAMAVNLAFQRGIKLDPCPNLAPYATSPADLARSEYVKHLFTLVSEEANQ